MQVREGGIQRKGSSSATMITAFGDLITQLRDSVVVRVLYARAILRP